MAYDARNVRATNSASCGYQVTAIALMVVAIKGPYFIRLLKDEDCANIFLTLLGTAHGWGLHSQDVPRAWYDETRHVRLDPPTSSPYDGMLT